MKKAPPFPIIKAEGAAYECGEQYGSQCREMIGRVIDFYRWIFEIKSKLSWEQSLAKAAEFAPFLDKYDGGIMEQIEGIARGAHRPVEEILALNVRTELLFLLAANLSAGINNGIDQAFQKGPLDVSDLQVTNGAILFNVAPSGRAPPDGRSC